MTGVVNAQFDDKVQQSAVTEFQLINKEVRQQLAAMRTEMAMMSRERKMIRSVWPHWKPKIRSSKPPPPLALATGPTGEPAPALQIRRKWPTATSRRQPPFIPAWVTSSQGK